MNILLVGGGGREHALVKKLRESPQVDIICALPGNGGMASEATCVDISATDLQGVTDFAKNNYVDFALVAPDDPLVMGLVDELEAAGIPCFGPNKAAAIIEGSKAFSKALMKKYGIPTAGYEIFSDKDAALRYLETAKMPIVIKADGLALGKGVIIAQTLEEAQNAVISMMEDGAFGESGNTIVIEEFLEGPEVTVLAFTDGKTILPLASSMDHKRALDGDEGLNTGGMGVIAPNPYYTPEIAKLCMDTIFIPTINAMNAEGRTFKGCLYFGLMLTKEGPKVIEYNCRFGDPEAQAVLPLLEADLVDIIIATRNQTLDKIPFSVSNRASCCIIMASQGYPQSYLKGFEIGCRGCLGSGVEVSFAGVRLEEGKLLTNGGRVLGVTAVADTLPEAIDKAYAAVGQIHFENAFYRKDIGKKALEA
ncbi:MAG: phosphoribosylamine--glycine ligase [Oscillospiraceae bacterium]|jgi:phosphoribosylamine--glycine ligase|nr:phosphoribosylamine--glycine ligase [Oscillospiraceae bacterium]